MALSRLIGRNPRLIIGLAIRAENNATARTDMTFADEFHEKVSKLEAWINAPPRECLYCHKAYKAHSMQESLRSESDPPETWYTEYGEQCPGDDDKALYVDPEI